MEDEFRLAVLGLGNVLCADDGIGVRVVGELSNFAPQYPAVDFIDAGVGGLRLLNRFDEFAALLALDAAEMKLPPASHRWITPRQVLAAAEASFSLHDLDFAQTLGFAERFFSRPATAILAIQPETVAPSEKLSPTLEVAVSHLVSEVCQALDNWLARLPDFKRALDESDLNQKDELFLSCLRPQRNPDHARTSTCP